MSEQDHPNIDELLNGFLDGELTERHSTEVKRLIKHDPEVAGKLEQLTKTKKLLASLPHEQAPGELLEKIKTRLERRMALGQPKRYLSHLGTPLNTQARQTSERLGARELLLRRTLAAAAMVALLAVLGVLVYSIVGPVEVPSKTPAAAELQRPKLLIPETVQTATPPVSYAKAPSIFTLEVKTTQPLAVNASISRTIYDNNLLDNVILEHPEPAKTSYQLTCSRQDVEDLLADLAAIWDKLDYTCLAVAGPTITEQAIVEDISVQQLLEIVKEPHVARRLRLAGDFATLNNIAKSTPAGEALAEIQGRQYNSFAAKPVLTSSRKKSAKGSIKPTDSETIQFVIIITGQ